MPELRVEAKKRGLSQAGKKQSLLARLSVRVRDEVATTLGVRNEIDSEEDSTQEELCIIREDDTSNHSDDDTFASESATNVLDHGSENIVRQHVGGSKASLRESLKMIFGYDDFREGQEWAIRRCLANEKSLLVAPTGQGKSLCYALPAAIMEGICVVVSPLVSLMEVGMIILCFNFRI